MDEEVRAFSECQRKIITKVICFQIFVLRLHAVLSLKHAPVQVILFTVDLLFLLSWACRQYIRKRGCCYSQAHRQLRNVTATSWEKGGYRKISKGEHSSSEVEEYVSSVGQRPDLPSWAPRCFIAAESDGHSLLIQSAIEEQFQMYSSYVWLLYLINRSWYLSCANNHTRHWAYRNSYCVKGFAIWEGKWIRRWTLPVQRQA